MRQISLILLTLTDGRIVFQRRTKDAPVSPGLLGLFGGKVEAGETFDEAMDRELEEETSLKVQDLNIGFVQEYTLDFKGTKVEPSTFHLYWAELANADFEVYEGDGAEVYSKSEALSRSDLTPSAAYVLNNILKEK